MSNADDRPWRTSPLGIWILVLLAGPLLGQAGAEQLIFVTERPVLPKLGAGGLAAMDATCQVKAERAGLDGTWIALLSDSSVTARQRLEQRALDGPFRNLDPAGGGSVVAQDRVDLFDGFLAAAIRYDETGAEVGDDSPTDAVWTASFEGGSYEGTSYGDWTDFTSGARLGRLTATGGQWLAGLDDVGQPLRYEGANIARLYCVRASEEPAWQPPPPPATTHTLFVTAADFLPDLGGLSGADAICQDTATGAGLGDRLWTAILSDSSTDARDRLLIGGPIFTTTGVRFAEDAGDLFDGDNFGTPADEHGGDRIGAAVFTGSRPDGTRFSGNPARFAEDWTDPSPAEAPYLGRVPQPHAGGYTGFGWLQRFFHPPPERAHLYCIDAGVLTGHRLFVTSTRYYGDMSPKDGGGSGLSGLAAADAACEERAAAGTIEPVGGGTSWKAILSTDLIDARDRLQIFGPVVRHQDDTAGPGGTPFVLATGAGDLFDGSIAGWARKDENADNVDSVVWTGSHADGTVRLPNCQNWTTSAWSEHGRRGSSNRNDAGWLELPGTNRCSHALPLFCIEQP